MTDQWYFWAAVAYASGSVPFGLLIGWARGVDLRRHGSGNLGATNAVRVLGKGWGGLCFVLDLLKGFVPVFAAGIALGMFEQVPTSAQATQAAQAAQVAQVWGWLGVAAGALLGHVFPVWLRFKGGKGVATGLGALLGVYPTLTWPVLAAAVVWIVIATVTRFVSLASMTAAAAIPLMLLAITVLRQEDVAQAQPFIIATGLMAVLVIFRHRGNVRRLIVGNEPRIGERADRASTTPEPAQDQPTQPA